MNALQTTLKQLRLSGLIQTLDVRLQEAAANRLSHAEFLELICQDELNVRQERQMDRHTKAADFRSLKPLDDFDWSFNPSVHKKEIYELANHFIFAELDSGGDEQKLKLVFTTHEISVRGHHLRRIETVMQRLELSLLAKLPNNQRKLITEGQPVILEIVVTEVENGKDEKS